MVELSPSFKLEYETLDRDHQRLADIVNEILKAIDDDEGEKCEDLALDFVKTAKSHFASEEAFLVKVGYPNVKKHQDHHKSLHTKMDHLLEFAKMAGVNPMARESLRKELTDLKFEAGAMRAQWEAEKQIIGEVRGVREQIEQTRRDMEAAERRSDLERAAELKYGRLPQLEGQLQAMSQPSAAADAATRLVREEVTEEEIAEIV